MATTRTIEARLRLRELLDKRDSSSRQGFSTESRRN